MKLKKPWWVCNKCEKPLVKTSTKRIKEMMFDHRKECDPLSGFYIKQIEQ